MLIGQVHSSLALAFESNVSFEYTYLGEYKSDDPKSEWGMTHPVSC